MGENNEQGNGDFNVQATAVLEKDISDIPDYTNASEADIAAAGAIQDEQEGVEVEELERQVQEADRRRKKHEGTGGSKSIEHKLEDAVKNMQSRLTEHYSQSIKEKRQDEEARQKQGLYGIVVRIKAAAGYKPSVPSDEQFLEKVLDEEVTFAQQIRERRKVRVEARERELDQSEELLGSSKEELRVNYELYEQAETKLKHLEESITEQKKLIRQYEDQRRKQNYDGSVDTLLDNARGAVVKEQEEKKKVDRCQKRLIANLEHYTEEKSESEGVVAETQFHYNFAHEKYQQARKAVRKLSSLRDNKNNRESILTGVMEIVGEDVRLRKSIKISDEGDLLIEILADVQAQDDKKDEASNRYSQLMGQQQEKADKKRKEILAECKRDVYNI